MALKKINLSALNKKSEEENHISPIIKVKNEPKAIEENIVNDTWIDEPKKKISLKKLKKILPEPQESEKEVLSSEVFSKQVISENIQENHISSEEILTQEILETSEIITTQESKEEIFQISDGDTNCNIVKEEKSEIFANYKWSFGKQPEEAPIHSEKKEEVNTQKVQNETLPLRSIDTENTNLERYAQSEEKKTFSKQKKVILSSMVWILALWIPWALFFPGGILKSNVSEINNVNSQIAKEELSAPIPVSNFQENITNPSEENIANNTDLPLSLENTKKEENENLTNMVSENIQSELTQNEWEEYNEGENIDIVKENIENEVDNIEKSTKINQKLHNYLLEKYKK